MNSARLVAVSIVLAIASSSAPAQDANNFDRAVHAGIEEVMAAVVSRGAPPKIDLYAGAFEPNCVFRGKRLTDWLRQLLDADLEGTARPAQIAFLDMEAKAVPFLIRASATSIDWDKADASSHPLLLCRKLGLPAVQPLVRLLESQHATLSWIVLAGIIRDSAKFSGEQPTKEARAAMNAAVTKIAESVAHGLNSKDAAARFGALSLLRLITLTGVGNAAFIGVPPRLHQMMQHDPDLMVREIACDLLIGLGVRGVEGGMQKVDIVILLKDDTLPHAVRHSLTAGLLWHVENEGSGPPKPPPAASR